MRLGSSHAHFLKEVAEIQHNFSVHAPVPLQTGEDTDLCVAMFYFASFFILQQKKNTSNCHKNAK